MENNLITKNKEAIKILISELPKKKGYAREIKKRLEEKGVTVTELQVYQTVSGKTYYNSEIALEIRIYHDQIIEKLSADNKVLS